jgi:hypothetical protein
MSFVFVTAYSTWVHPTAYPMNAGGSLAEGVKPTKQSNAEAKNAFLYTLRHCFLI